MTANSTQLKPASAGFFFFLHLVVVSIDTTYVVTHKQLPLGCVIFPSHNFYDLSVVFPGEENMDINLETASTDEVLAHAYATRLDDPLVAELCKRLEVANETLDAMGEHTHAETPAEQQPLLA